MNYVVTCMPDFYIGSLCASPIATYPAPAALMIVIYGSKYLNKANGEDRY
jgi:hypothetical protein